MVYVLACGASATSEKNTSLELGSMYLVDLVSFSLICPSHHPVVYVLACGASATSEKTRPWNFGACILWILLMFVDFCGF